MTVTEFVLARIAEDEARATRASSSDWPVVANAAAGCSVNAGWHVLDHNPARVLAQCAAMRKIVEIHHPHDHQGEHGDAVFCDECQWDHADDSPRIDNQPVEGFGDHPCQTLIALASIWSSHPDRREEWA